MVKCLHTTSCTARSVPFPSRWRDIDAGPSLLEQLNIREAEAKEARAAATAPALLNGWVLAALLELEAPDTWELQEAQAEDDDGSTLGSMSADDDEEEKNVDAVSDGEEDEWAGDVMDAPINPPGVNVILDDDAGSEVDGEEEGASDDDADSVVSEIEQQEVGEDELEGALEEMAGDAAVGGDDEAAPVHAGQGAAAGLALEVLPSSPASSGNRNKWWLVGGVLGATALAVGALLRSC
jgi:hypothetical protein